MFKKLENLSTFNQVNLLTTSLVNILSINGTVGEVEIANKIEEILRSFPYFKDSPEMIWTQPLPNDGIGRKNVFARIKGNGASKKTVIYHAHLDTVGTDDYGKIQELANIPERLLEFFKSWEGNKEIQEQAHSGDWMFGRGALDMKSGIAVHLANILYLSEHRDKWDGEIIFMVNPVEENQHTGVIAAVDELLRLRKEEQLDYIVAINTDYITSLFPGDEQKYIYTGAVGKLLPCFYVYGRETHVGRTLDGLDPTLVTSELNRLINNNMELIEQVEGELMTPPSVLYHRDTKNFYNVQTAVTSHIYFNLMVLEDSPQVVVEKLKRIANKAARTTETYYQKQYQLYALRNHFPEEMPKWEMEVYTFEEYCEKLRKQGVDVEGIAEQMEAAYKEEDPREVCFQIVDSLRQQDATGVPCIIIFFAPPYCPHHYLIGESKRDKRVIGVIDEVVGKWEYGSVEQFSIKRFFPYLSDSSYLSLHDTEEEIESLIHNFPEWKSIYPVPVDKIRELNVPAINIGVYGMDAHRWTERVYKPYSFETLPHLIRDLTVCWLGK